MAAKRKGWGGMQEWNSWKEVPALGGREGTDFAPAALPLVLLSRPQLSTPAPASLRLTERVRSQAAENQGPPVPPQGETSAVAVGAGMPVPAPLAFRWDGSVPGSNAPWFPLW